MAVEATCTEPGLAAGSHCSVCETVLKAQQEIAALDHSYGKWFVTGAPACTETGEERRDCERCDSFETREVAAAGHIGVNDAAVDATCTENGLTEGSHCSVCKTVLKQQEIVPALGHGYEQPAFEWEDDSCTAIFICGICSDEEKLPCEVSEETVPATELEAGQTTYTAEVLEERTYRDTLVVIIPKLEHVTHKPGADWHYDGKNHWKECSICGEKSDVSGHTSGGVIPEDTAWSCEICGVKIYTRERLDWFFRRMETRENYLWASGTYGKILDRYGN